MTMRRDQLPINEPCHESWDDMEGGNAKRFCGSCTKHVHYLSEMKEADAMRLLREGENLCIRYAYRADGSIRFLDSECGPTPPKTVEEPKHVVSRTDQLRLQERGLARLSLAASTLLAAGLIAACDANASMSESAGAGESTIVSAGEQLLAQRNSSAGNESATNDEGGEEQGTPETAALNVAPGNTDLLHTMGEPPRMEEPLPANSKQAIDPQPDVMIMGGMLEVPVEGTDKPDSGRVDDCEGGETGSGESDRAPEMHYMGRMPAPTPVRPAPTQQGHEEPEYYEEMGDFDPTWVNEQKDK